MLKKHTHKSANRKKVRIIFTILKEEGLSKYNTKPRQCKMKSF